MTPSQFDLLSDTGDHDAADDSRPTTTKSLAEMAETPASELFVWEAHRNCWAKRWIKRFRLWLAFSLGAAIVLQVGGVWIVRSAVKDLDSRTAETVRKTVEQVLREHKIISDDSSFRDFLASETALMKGSVTP